MRLHPNDSNTVAAAVRAYLGISQTELGRWLGVSVSLVSDAEAGRKRFGAPASDHLRRLVQCLPAVLPPLAYAPAPAADAVPAAVPAAMPAAVAAPPPAGAPPDALRARLAATVHAANAQRATLAQQHRYGEAAARWAAALPGLTAAVCWIRLHVTPWFVPFGGHKVFRVCMVGAPKWSRTEKTRWSRRAAKLPFYVAHFEWLYNLRQAGKAHLQHTLLLLFQPDLRTDEQCLLPSV